MKSYIVKKGNSIYSFDDKKKAEEYGKKMGIPVSTEEYWKVWLANLPGDTLPGYLKITGSTLKEAIKSNMDKILRGSNLYGVSGGELVSADIITKGTSDACLRLKVLPYGKLGMAESMQEKDIEIAGVTPRDIDYLRDFEATNNDSLDVEQNEECDLEL